MKRPRSPSPVQPSLDSHFLEDYEHSPSYSDGGPEANTPVENDCTPCPRAVSFEQVQSKVRAMYEAGIDMRVIQALFGIPPVLVHSWGDFTRSKHCERMKHARTLLAQKVNGGEDLREAVKGMRMTKSHAEYMLGQCGELETAYKYSEAQRKGIIEEARKAPRPGNVARKYGLPKVALHRWLRGDFSHVDGESPFITSDEWGSASQKRRCIEAFFLNKRDYEKSATAAGVTTEQATRAVDEFERRLVSRKEAIEEAEEPF